MFHIPKMQDPAEYKKEWEAGLHQTEYNACRFAEDKTAFAKHWLDTNVPWANYENPKNMIDIICHEKIYNHDVIRSKWADKMCSHWNLYEENMTELTIEPVMYSCCFLTDSDWKNLPNGKYIIKMAHGSGWNIKFEKTDNFDPTYIQQKVWEWYNLNYAYITGYEQQYEEITPGFVIQPDLGQLMNWEFWCLDGKIVSLNLSQKESKNFVKSIAWVGGQPIGAPPYRKFLTPSENEIFERMKPYVLKLAAPHKFVRVDLYHINNEIKFSELTFTPSSGRLVFV